MRTEKTICLAVSPSLKAYGIPGRARLFEVVQKVKEANEKRLRNAPNRRFTGSSDDANVLAKDPSLAINYIVAPPQMAHYMKITPIYIRYICVTLLPKIFMCIRSMKYSLTLQAILKPTK